MIVVILSIHLMESKVQVCLAVIVLHFYLVNILVNILLHLSELYCGIFY